MDDMMKGITFMKASEATSTLVTCIGFAVNDKEERDDLVERAIGVHTLLMSHMGITPNKSFDDIVEQLVNKVEAYNR